MKISNFRLERTEGCNPITWVYHASVDVETGFLFWKKKERRKIIRRFAEYWHFVDSGEFVPGYSVEALARAWQAQTGDRC